MMLLNGVGLLSFLHSALYRAIKLAGVKNNIQSEMKILVVACLGSDVNLFGSCVLSFHNCYLLEENCKIAKCRLLFRYLLSSSFTCFGYSMLYLHI